MNCDSFVIKSKKNLAKDIFDLTIDCPEIAKSAKPGQFVDVKCDSFTLRRPISICDIDKKRGLIRLVFQIRGQGTAWLADKNAGGCLNILGPLGNGYDVPESGSVMFVGGGIGVPPLLGAARLCGKRASAILGFRSADAVILKDDFESCGARLTICTDDGTAGRHALVTEPLLEALQNGKFTAVFACGPKPMLKFVAKICEEQGVKCFVSLEERMACGIGACLGCAVKIKCEDGEKYLHVCHDGPVFDAASVIW